MPGMQELIIYKTSTTIMLLVYWKFVNHLTVCVCGWVRACVRVCVCACMCALEIRKYTQTDCPNKSDFDQ